MGELSRRKGKVWEQECARRLKAIFGDQVKRGLAQSRFGACEAPDVTNVPGWWVECKHEKQVNLRAALKQAVEAEALCRSNTIRAGFPMDSRRPVAFCKDNRSEPVAILRLDDFLEIARSLWQLTKPREEKPDVQSTGPQQGAETNGSQT